MKLQELLKIDTSKSNWFKIFARNGINVKTVSSVSNGGGVGNSRIKYYRFKNVGDKTVLDEIIMVFEFFSMYKYRYKNGISILTFNTSESIGSDFLIDLTHVQFSPIYTDGIMVNNLDDVDKLGGTNYSQYFEPTTEEEFYKVE